MSPIKLFITGCLAMVVNTPVYAEQPGMKDLAQHVREAESAFAETMAMRQFDRFLSFISDEAIFFSGDKPLRGKEQIGEAWRPYFNDPGAPFSWEPEVVEVLESGTLALSSGPVHAADGKLVGRFNSIWRFEPETNRWKVIFDKGSNVCNCETP